MVAAISIVFMFQNILSVVIDEYVQRNGDFQEGKIMYRVGHKEEQFAHKCF